MIAHFISKQFSTFLLTSSVAAILNFTSRIVYNHWVNYSTAILLAYISGMTAAFILAKLFVFTESQQSMYLSATIFTFVNLIAALQTWGISLWMALYILPWLGITHFVLEIAHAAGILAPIFTSYLGHKYGSFR